MRVSSIILLASSLSLNALGQTSGDASIAGNCNIVNTGNSSHLILSFTPSCGIGKEQGEKIIGMLKKILAAQDPNKILATLGPKLDEIIAAEAARSEAHGGQSVGQVTCDNNSGNCAGINNGQQIVNKYDSPPVEIITSHDNVGPPTPSPDGHPRAVAKFYVSRPWDTGLFAVICDRPCHGYSESACALDGYNSSRWGKITGLPADYPEITVLMFNRQFPAGFWCRTAVESEDDQPVEILSVKTLTMAEGQKPPAN